jgi:hypothetical protein
VKRFLPAGWQPSSTLAERLPPDRLAASAVDVAVGEVRAQKSGTAYVSPALAPWPLRRLRRRNAALGETVVMSAKALTRTQLRAQRILIVTLTMCFVVFDVSVAGWLVYHLFVPSTSHRMASWSAMLTLAATCFGTTWLLIVRLAKAQAGPAHSAGAPNQPVPRGAARKRPQQCE